MDLSETIAPTSDQLDAIDLLAGPRTFTIESVSKGSAEQPVNIHLAGFPRPWRPGKSMRRVLVAVWGPKATEYVGRRLTLFNDEAVKFGGVTVGGVRISHMSHLDKPKTIVLLVTRGKSAPFVVKPLAEDEPQPEPAGVEDFALATREKLQQVAAAFGAIGISSKEEMLEFASQRAGRTLGSATELSAQEADELLASLHDAASEPTLGGDWPDAFDPAGDPPIDGAEAQ